MHLPILYHVFRLVTQILHLMCHFPSEPDLVYGVSLHYRKAQNVNTAGELYTAQKEYTVRSLLHMGPPMDSQPVLGVFVTLHLLQIMN